MARIFPKGASFNLDAGAGLAAVSQVISIDLPDQEQQTVATPALDDSDAGIVYTATGFVEGGSAGCEYYLDPNLHSGLYTLLQTPDCDGFSGSIGTPAGCGSGAGGTLAFTVAGIGLGGSIQQGDAIKGTLTAKLSGTADWS